MLAHKSGAWIAVQPTERLPADSKISVKVKAGAPSLEGPLSQAKDHVFHFETHGPLRVEKQRYGWDDDRTPGQGLTIGLNNRLGAETGSSQIKVEPELQDKSVLIGSDTIYIHGQTQPRTTYRVTLPSSLRDEYGQTLGEEVTLEFSMGSATPSLRVPDGFGRMRVLEPNQPRTFPICSR